MEENEFAHKLLEKHQNTLGSAYNYIKSKIDKKLNTFYKPENHNKLELTITIRLIMNTMGYSNIHDIEVLKILKNTFYDYSDNIAKEIIQAMRCGRRIEVEEKKKVQQVIEYVKTQFSAYDYKSNGRLEAESLILLFLRFCLPSNDLFPIDVCKEFNLCIQNNTKTFSKEDTIRFLIDHLKAKDVNVNKSSELPKIRVSGSIQSLKGYEQKEVQKSCEPQKVMYKEEDCINGLKDQLSEIQSKINLLSKSQIETKKYIQHNAGQLGVMKDIVRNSITNDKIRFYSIGQPIHKCNSSYCLLCKGYYN